MPSALLGEKIAALGITEPGGGSDVAAIKTTAVLDGDHYVINGEKTFDQALIEHQVVRHKLVDMQMLIASTQAWCDALTVRADAGEEAAGGDISTRWIAQVCMLKNHATQTMQFCADQAVHRRS